MYVISVKTRDDYDYPFQTKSEWTYFQYDCSLGYPCFGEGLSHIVRRFKNPEEAEREFIEQYHNLNLNPEKYDLSTLGIREVKLIFKTEKIIDEKKLKERYDY